MIHCCMCAADGKKVRACYLIHVTLQPLQKAYVQVRTESTNKVRICECGHVHKTRSDKCIIKMHTQYRKPRINCPDNYCFNPPESADNYFWRTIISGGQLFIQPSTFGVHSHFYWVISLSNRTNQIILTPVPQ